MKKTRVVFLFAMMNLLFAETALAAKGSICDGNGGLKGWAKNKGHSVEECAPVSNTAPNVTITSPQDLSVYDWQVQLGFSASASDAEDGDLSSSVSWTSSIDGAISAGTLLSVGTHTITASVSDSATLTAADSITVTIVEPVNVAPVVQITSPADSAEFEQGTALLFKVNASDPEDGDLSAGVTWSSSIDGAITNFTTLSVGDHLITATVADTQGLQSYDQISVSITEIPVVQLHTIQLSWLAPVVREDGEPLFAEEIAGYEITLTNLSSGASETVMLEDGAATSYNFADLEPSMYSVVLRTKDANGLVSADSDVLEIGLDGI